MKLADLFRRKKNNNPETERRSLKRTAPLPNVTDVNTAPLTEQQIQAVLARAARIVPQQLQAACGQSVGKQREHNEDSLVTFSLTMGGEGSYYPLGLYIIADGMGGYQYGEVASSVASHTVASILLRKIQPAVLEGSLGMEEPLQEVMRAAIDEAQVAVQRAAPGGGTTLTAIMVVGQQLTVGHVGDSRAYAIRPDGRIEAITRDHTLVKRLEELGQITPAEAFTHPQRNVLYRALGQGETLEPDVFTTQFPQPGYLMLCSDGLWSVVPDGEIQRIIQKSSNPTNACQALLAAANEAGGPDNISVILVQLIG